VSEPLHVTAAQVLAAKLDVELSEEAGDEPDEAVEAIAEAGVVFTRDYVKYGLRSEKTYQQGTTGIVTRIHTGPLGEITHVDVRLKDGEFLREVPVDFFKP
jgi:hypothetical protein